jgi:hypothetical protein
MEQHWSFGLTSQSFGLTSQSFGLTSQSFGLTSQSFGLTSQSFSYHLIISNKVLGYYHVTLVFDP